MELVFASVTITGVVVSNHLWHQINILLNNLELNVTAENLEFWLFSQKEFRQSEQCFVLFYLSQVSATL